MIEIFGKLSREIKVSSSYHATRVIIDNNDPQVQEFKEKYDTYVVL